MIGDDDFIINGISADVTCVEGLCVLANAIVGDLKVVDNLMCPFEG